MMKKSQIYIAFFGWCFMVNATIHSALLDQAPTFVGGDKPSQYIPGIVRLGRGDFVFKNCTATLVSSTFLLTASHCISHDPEVLLDIHSTYPTPLKEKIEILSSNGNIVQKNIIIKKIHLYPAFYFQNDLTKVKGRDFDEKFAHTIEVGDIALIELENLDLEIRNYPKILFQSKKIKNELWVGGFGLKNIKSDSFFNSTYAGSSAILGTAQNAFYDSSSSGFSRESLVSFKILNLESDISYFTNGDSGGGVFLKMNKSNFVLGINHASRFVLFGKVNFDEKNEKIISRPKSLDGDIIGYVHIFRMENKRLFEWVSKILPKDRIQVL